MSFSSLILLHVSIPLSKQIHGTQSLKLVGTENITNITEQNTGTYDLYYISESDLQVNPIVENAKDIRDQSFVCDVTFQAYDDHPTPESYVDTVISSIEDCAIDVCNSTVCEPITKDDCNPSEEGCIINGYTVSFLTSYPSLCYSILFHRSHLVCPILTDHHP